MARQDPLRKRTKTRTRQKTLPVWLTDTPDLDDGLETSSSRLQKETAEECLPYLLGNGNARDVVPSVNQHGVPKLDRVDHIKFCRMMLGRLPDAYAALDASRPWMLYWCLSSLALLGVDVSEYREAVISTLRPLQNASGGFGGGHSQYSHLATSYAALLSLVIVGGEEAYEMVDRKSMWNWLGMLKQPEGDFQMSVGGERDTRGAYCAMVMISLLNLPTFLPQHSPALIHGDETFVTGLAEWLSQCQSFDGGIANTPGSESHGAYTFCALACLCILGRPQEMMQKYLNIPDLVNWLTTRQHAPEGGLAGRANKLVDGCYSHWIGGCWSLVEAGAAVSGPGASESLFNREGLIRYILCCCQNHRGGLRDKPSKRPDAYHSCYNLNGLSSAQHNYYYDAEGAGPSSGPLAAAFNWNNTKVQGKTKGGAHNQGEEQIYNADDVVPLINPVYVVPAGAAENMRQHFESHAKF